jgi:hypothetical protein
MGPCKLSGVAEKCLVVVGRGAARWADSGGCHRLHTKLRSTATISGVLIRQQLFFISAHSTPPVRSHSFSLFIFIRNKLIRVKTQRDFLRGASFVYLFTPNQRSVAIYLIRENSTFQNRGSVVEGERTTRIMYLLNFKY